MNYVICPYCGCQYLPGEIFSPKYFLGQPKNIIRNIKGEILGSEGIDMDLSETFTCEVCNKDFDVKAKIEFKYNGEENSDTELAHPVSLF